MFASTARVGTALRDTRFAARALRREPLFTLVAGATLALGIAAVTAIFSVVKPLVLEPLGAYPHADRLMAVWYAGTGGVRAQQAFGTYREIATRSRTFEAVAASRAWQPTVTSAVAGGTAEPERLEGQRVSASYLGVLGVRPAIGRELDPADDRLHGPDVAVISDTLWHRRFDSNPAIVGRTVTLDDRAFTVIGVMQKGFEDVLAPAAEVWGLLQYDDALPADGREWGHNLRMIGRLRPDATVAQAESELASIARLRVPEFSRPPWASMSQGLIVTPLDVEMSGAVRPALTAVALACGLLLAIACINVINLVLARGVRREPDFSLRAALGAERLRLVRQVLTETVVLALAGGVAAAALAFGAVRALVAISPPGLSAVGRIVFDGGVLAFALGTTTLVGLIVGMIPALHASRRDLNRGMQRGSVRTGGGPRLTRYVLVTTEMALAVLLLVTAGLLLRSVDKLFAVDPGFNPDGVLTAQVRTPGLGSTKDATDLLFAEDLAAVRAVPGVTAAGFTSQLPLSGADDEYGARFEGDDPKTGQNVLRYAVSAGYFDAAGIPMRAGRVFSARDRSDTPPVAVISASLARRRFAGQEAVGQRVHLGPATAPWYTIVGVVGDVRQVSLAVSQPDAVYIPTTQSWFSENPVTFVVRSGDAATIPVKALKAAVWSVNARQPVTRIATMAAVVRDSAGGRRLALLLFEMFGIVALVLAATGIFGVVSSHVAERRREIGVRAALGASRRAIMSLVVRQGMAPAIVGAVVGLGATIAASGAVQPFLFGVSHLDAATYVVVAILLVAISALACWIPAWRAVRVDPTEALRAE